MESQDVEGIADRDSGGGLEMLREAVDQSFERDWEFDSGLRVFRRKSDAQIVRHPVWALYRWLKHRYLDTPKLQGFVFPLKGDNMPSVPGLPRKWLWKSDVLRINEADLEYLAAGPLVDQQGHVLVEANRIGERWSNPPVDIESEVESCNADWKFVPGGREIRRRSAASSTKHRVEALYWASSMYAASSEGIVFDVPIGRDDNVFPGVPRRYWVTSAWRLRADDAAYLTDGPLFNSDQRMVTPPANAAARRFNLEEIDSFTRISEIDPSLAVRQVASGYLKVPEKEVKGAIHRALGDPYVRADHGGERSDIFTADVKLGGRRVLAAFALKGPSAGRKITMAKYGKNGDQIVRLFEEPAELFIIQANGEFESLLVKHVQQTAESQHRPLGYCLVNGRDTARFLLAYI